MARTVVELEAGATVLDASRRLAAVEADGDVALVVAPGSPVLRNALFLDVLRAQVSPRRLSLVTADARARSVASAAHVPSYATVAALERHELDATERLTPARHAGIAPARHAPSARRAPPLGRVAAVSASLLGAAAILAAVTVPSASVTIAPSFQPFGPVEVTVRGTTGGSADVGLRTLTEPIAAKVAMAASGSRNEEIRAKGTLQLENKTTDDVRVAFGSIFRTADGVRFLAIEDVTVPRSVIIPPFQLFVGRKAVAIQASAPGPAGNVAPGRIVVGPDPARYTVTNTEPTTGGEIRRIPVVRIEDYDAAVRKAPQALQAAADSQLATWVKGAKAGDAVVPRALARQTSVAPASADVVGKEVASFELTVSGIASAYVTSDAEPRRAIAARMRDAVGAGNDVDERSVRFDVRSLTVADDGVTWTVTARGQQTKRVDGDRIGRLLAGHRVGDAGTILGAEGLRLVRLEWVPAWWPLLPLLDGRIAVQVQPPPAGAAP